MALNIFSKSFGNNDVTDALPAINESAAIISEIATKNEETQNLSREIEDGTKTLNQSVTALESLAELESEQQAKLEATESDSSITVDDNTYEPLTNEEIGNECIKIRLAMSNTIGVLGGSYDDFVSSTSYGNNAVGFSNDITSYRAGVEGLGEFIKKIKDKIVAFFKFIWSKIKQFWNWITGNSKETEQQVKATAEEVKALPAEEKAELEKEIKEDPEAKQAIINLDIAEKTELTQVNKAIVLESTAKEVANLVREVANSELDEKEQALVFRAIKDQSLVERISNSKFAGMVKNFWSSSKNKLAGIYNKFSAKLSLEMLQVDGNYEIRPTQPTEFSIKDTSPKDIVITGVIGDKTYDVLVRKEDNGIIKGVLKGGENFFISSLSTGLADRFVQIAENQNANVEHKNLETVKSYFSKTDAHVQEITKNLDNIKSTEAASAIVGIVTGIGNEMSNQIKEEVEKTKVKKKSANETNKNIKKIKENFNKGKPVQTA